MITEYVMKGSKRGPKPLTPAQQKEREKKVEKIKKDMLRKIHIIDPKFSQELKEELGRSKRGEHVFNNDILKFHFKVLTNFIQSHHITNLRGYNQHQEAVDELGKHTLPRNTAQIFRQTWWLTLMRMNSTWMQMQWCMVYIAEHCVRVC